MQKALMPEIVDSRIPDKYTTGNDRVQCIPVVVHQEKHIIHHYDKEPRNNRRNKPRKNYQPPEPHILTHNEYRIYRFWKATIYGGLTKVDFKKAYDAGVTYELYAWYIKCAKGVGKLRPIDFICNIAKDCEHMADGMASARDSHIWGCVKSMFYGSKIATDWLLRSGYGGEPFDTSLVYI